LGKTASAKRTRIILTDLKISMSFQHFNPAVKSNMQIQSPMCTRSFLVFRHMMKAIKGAARGGAEGAQAPPLAIRILMFIS